MENLGDEFADILISLFLLLFIGIFSILSITVMCVLQWGVAVGLWMGIVDVFAIGFAIKFVVRLKRQLVGE